MTTRDKIDFKELEDYRPWTLEEVPIGATLGMWTSNHSNKWIFIGKCLIVGVEKIYNDTDSFEIYLGQNSRWDKGVKQINQTNLLGGEYIQYRLHHCNEWIPCGYKKKIEFTHIKSSGTIEKPKTEKLKKLKNKEKISIELDTRCECRKHQYCSADLRIDCLTGHSSTCPHVGIHLMMDKTAELLKQLTVGIESWAKDEDGVHPDVWNAYVKAKTIIGEANTLGKES